MYNVLMRGCAIAAFGVAVSYTTAITVAHAGRTHVPPEVSAGALAILVLTTTLRGVGWIVRQVVSDELAKQRPVLDDQVRELITDAIQRAERRGIVREASDRSVLQFGRQQAREE